MKNQSLVKDRLREAKAIAWDGCHKIYILMDDEQVRLMREYKYEHIVMANEDNLYDMVDTINDWYFNSCPLRFIDAVSTDPIDPNMGFETLISQFEDEEIY